MFLLILCLNLQEQAVYEGALTRQHSATVQKTWIVGNTVVSTSKIAHSHTVHSLYHPVMPTFT